MIRDLLKKIPVKCVCYYFIFVNCGLYATVFRDFINIFLVICERDHFPRENDDNFRQISVFLKETVMRQWNIFSINTSALHTQRIHYFSGEKGGGFT